MNRFITVAMIMLIALAGCSADTTHEGAADTTTENVADTAAEVAPVGQSTVPEHVWRGKVVETMNSGGYTYVLMDSGAGQKWVAGPETVIAVGDKVAMLPGMAMRNFTSKTLDRTFEVIYFVGAIELDDGHTH